MCAMSSNPQTLTTSTHRDGSVEHAQERDDRGRAREHDGYRGGEGRDGTTTGEADDACRDQVLGVDLGFLDERFGEERLRDRVHEPREAVVRRVELGMVVGKVNFGRLYGVGDSGRQRETAGVCVAECI